MIGLVEDGVPPLTTVSLQASNFVVNCIGGHISGTDRNENRIIEAEKSWYLLKAWYSKYWWYRLRAFAAVWSIIKTIITISHHGLRYLGDMYGHSWPGDEKAVKRVGCSPCGNREVISELRRGNDYSIANIMFHRTGDSVTSRTLAAGAENVPFDPSDRIGIISSAVIFWYGYKVMYRVLYIILPD